MRKLALCTFFLLCNLCSKICSSRLAIVPLGIQERAWHADEKIRITDDGREESIMPMEEVTKFEDTLKLGRVLVDALDETRFALENERAIYFKNPIQPPKEITPIGPFDFLGSRNKSDKMEKLALKRRRQFRPVRPVKRAPVNKFLQAMNQIDKGLRDADAMISKQNVNTLKQQIKLACNSREYVFARKLLGNAIYNVVKARKSRGRKRRSSSSTAAVVLNDIKSQIGNDQFQKLMAFNGMVSLAFAIDTTGSMNDEITAAKGIVKGIVDWKRNKPDSVDYILSPFNDPLDPGVFSLALQHGQVKYAKTKNAFLKHLGELTANGGGDCKEMAIEGIQNIFTSSIQFNSPIYIFTDAGAKDATKENIEALKAMAQRYQTSLNFFLSNAGCMKKEAINLYKSLADETGGQILYFTSSTTLTKMSNFVTQALIGGTTIPVIANRRQRRSVGSNSYSIQVDNSMDVLSATIMTSSTRANVQLLNPGGTIQIGSKTDTGKGSLFLVKKPSPGVWKLVVPPSAGEHFVTARAVSEENIDFDFYFLVEARLGRELKTITTSTPLTNKQVTLVITVPAHERTITSSFKIKVVNKSLQELRPVSLMQNGRSPGRYSGSFSPPSERFRLLLEGKTKEGILFKRLSSSSVKATSAVIHVYAAPRGFILNAGGSTTTIILFAVNNYGRTEAFTVKVKELNKYSKRNPKRLFVVNGRMSMFLVRFKAPKEAKKGSTHKVVVTVIGQRSGTRANILVSLLVV